MNCVQVPSFGISDFLTFLRLGQEFKDLRERTVNELTASDLHQIEYKDEETDKDRVFISICQFKTSLCSSP